MDRQLCLGVWNSVTWHTFLRNNKAMQLYYEKFDMYITHMCINFTVRIQMYNLIQTCKLILVINIHYDLNGICEGMKSCNGRLVHVYILISLELHEVPIIM